MTMNLHDVEIEMIRELLAEHRWSRAGLRVALERFDRQEFDDAFASLVVAGVAVADRVDVQASRQLRHLAALGVLTLDAPNAPRTRRRSTVCWCGRRWRRTLGVVLSTRGALG